MMGIMKSYGKTGSSGVGIRWSPSYQTFSVDKTVWRCISIQNVRILGNTAKTFLEIIKRIKIDEVIMTTGKGWGKAGYGWLPNEYIARGLAEDFWSILKKEWVDTGEFVE
jgi:hypothetical protein